jgi:CDP-4-dehydro-6-deoxyglucose reductase
MGFQVSVQPSRHTFHAEPDETILEAALRQGLSFPYGCRDGVCGTCRGKVLSGELAHGKAPFEVLSAADRQAGFALFCCAMARSDLCLESREVSSTEDIPIRTLPARVHKLTRAAPDVMIVDLKLPASERLQFLAGQYVDILAEGRPAPLVFAGQRTARRRRSGAACPAGAGRAVSPDTSLDTMKERDLLRLRGPHGSFFLREDAQQADAAGGRRHGLCAHQGDRRTRHRGSMHQRPMHVYWGGRGRADLYLSAPGRAVVCAEHAHIDFTPVLSDSPVSRTLAGSDAAWCTQRPWRTTPRLADYQVIRLWRAGYGDGPPGATF